MAWFNSIITRIRQLPAAASILGWLAITTLLYAPVKWIMDTELDSSNYASYTYFAAHNVQYGPEVVPMSGPYGFVMYGFVYNGELFWSRLVWQLIVAGAMAALLLWFFRQSKGSAWRWVWLPAVLVLSPLIEDLPYEWTILISGLFLLRRNEQKPTPRWIIPIVALLAFISLIKGTHLILSVFTLGVVLVRHLLAKDWRQTLWIGCSYLVAFLGLWLFAGQNPLNIPSFLKGIRELTNGYNQAMALDEIPSIFHHGVTAFVVLFIGLTWAVWQKRRDLTVFAGLILFAGFTFVKWKHGFVRADGHIYIFFRYVMVAGMMIYLYAHRPFLPLNNRGPRFITWTLLIATLIAGFNAEQIRVNFLTIRWLTLTWTPQRFITSATQLLHLSRQKAEFDKKLQAQREAFNMPLTQQAIGTQGVDFFGTQHGIIQLNRLKYTPRPMSGGSFNVYNSYLMRLNRDFLRDPARRPNFYLTQFSTIDNRVAPMDDGLTLLEILHSYQPILVEQGHTLLQVRPKPTASPEPKFISRQMFNFSDFVHAPPVGENELLLARFDIPSSLLGDIRSALYKSPLLFMTLQGRNIEQPESRRFIPSMATTPFLLSPMLENTVDFTYLYSHREGKRVDGFFIYTDHPKAFKGPLTVEFYTLPKPAPPENIDVNELMTAVRYPIANVHPDRIVPEDSIQLSLGRLLVQRLLPPGEIHWKLHGSEREFLFDYGFVPEAYERGTSNGASFFVEIRKPGFAATRIFSTSLDPNRKPEDRGTHTARVPLPLVQEGSELVLMTDPGEYGDTAWDWTYVTRMIIKRGPFTLSQFPAFNRAPDTVDGENSAVLDLGAEKVYLLHVPGVMTFSLTGKERSLQFEYGFMEGAYTKDGNTTGAVYVVELVHPGQPHQVLFRRELHPVSQPNDRGRFKAELELPQILPGDKLIIKTTSVSGGSNSWGWTYLANLKIH